MHPSTFEYLKPTPQQMTAMSAVRNAFGDLAHVIACWVPDGPDRDHLERRLREAGMWANVAITRHEDGSPRLE